MGMFNDLKVEAQKSALFETPIVVAKVKNAEPLIDALRNSILEKMSTDEGMRRSNVGGWHSDTEMLSWGGEAAQALSERVVSMAKRMSSFADRSHDQFSWWCQMWANVSKQGAWNHMHIHPGNLWSAVFYVDMGGENVGGSFYFEDPRFPIAAMHNTRFRFPDEEGRPQSWQPEIRLNAGNILMFPSWLRHGVRTYEGDGTRISIAMNVDATPL